MEHHIIIGAGSGIGAALARAIAGARARLLLHTGHNRERLQAVAEDCRRLGAEVDTCIGGTEDEALFGAVAAWCETLPADGLTGFTFAAGYAKRGTVSDVRADELVASLAAMPLAFQRLATLLSPRLADNRGRIVCVSAFGAHRTKTRSYASTAPAKAALEAQVRVYAANLAPRGITVNAVVPGYIAKEPGTPSSLTPAQWQAVVSEIPMARVGAREEVAAVVKFLLSPEAGYLTGQSIHVNGGLTL
ncbi:SDR family NAD(P)-dependent oxidoreductase [Acuticoccus mangrovi]|uniref:SDR family oxidoreductase n=1 Tax=Acuticoccus mangrovi TaxID=2796142 RepID=A0A934IP32_9HYPH|nr:SDR family oxidoreductase [Acuticoccus mangrovi]MBJ3776031.1 SDR family oxidoreductase [Acuticoccus mangrovi]